MVTTIRQQERDKKYTTSGPQAI